MTDKEKQIADMAHYVCTSCEYEYNGTCDLHRFPEQCHSAVRVAEALYNAGYRKLEEHEWEEVAIVKSGEIVKRCYECPVCSALCDTKEPLCPACGAKMNGGGGDDR